MDFNIYDFCYDAFNMFVDDIDTRYNQDRDVLNAVVIDFLTNKNSKYNKYFIDIIKNDKLDVSLSMLKRIIMLMLASKSYIMRIYDEEIGINSYYASSNDSDINFKDVIDYFYSNNSIVLDYIDDYLAYINRPYIFHNMSKSLIIKKGLLEELLSINPFEVLSLGDYIKDDAYLKSEVTIQQFFDMLDASIVEIHEIYGEEKEDVLGEIFLSKIEEANVDKNEFIQYIMSNVYETLVIASNTNDPDFLEYIPLKSVIEENNIKILIRLFCEDASFRYKIIDAFIVCNDALVEGDLLEKRDAFNETGDIKLLRKLNPYYLEEEIIYKKMRESN